MGKNVLREVEYEEFFQSLDVLKEKVTTVRFYEHSTSSAKTRGWTRQFQALKIRFRLFKQAITESGYSSFLYNQNVYSPKNPTEQKLSLALCISEKLLNVGKILHTQPL